MIWEIGCLKDYLGFFGVHKVHKIDNRNLGLPERVSHLHKDLQSHVHALQIEK